MKKKKKKEGKFIHLGQSSAECPEIQGNGFLLVKTKYLQPEVLQFNIAGTATSQISMVKCLAYMTKTLVILLQETHCTCIDKLVIQNFALAGSIPSRKHGLAIFVYESFSWTQTGWSQEDSEI